MTPEPSRTYLVVSAAGSLHVGTGACPVRRDVFWYAYPLGTHENYHYTLFARHRSTEGPNRYLHETEFQGLRGDVYVCAERYLPGGGKDSNLPPGAAEVVDLLLFDDCSPALDAQYARARL